MRFARVVITAATDAWALEAARSMTGFATSVIGCKCEAAIERSLTSAETPDGRPGIAVLLFAMDREGVGKRSARARRAERDDVPDDRVLRRRSGAEKTVPLGASLRYFGDGFQASKVIAGKRFWRIPVMEGEFLVCESVGVGQGVGGGNLVIGAGDEDAALAAAQAAAQAMRGEGIALPFPGGIVRSGSKVGALTSKSLPASTNHQMAPTLRVQVDDTLVPDGVAALFEIVIDGVVRGRRPRGDAPRAARRRRRRRDARHRRQLRRQARPISLPALRAARPAVTLTLTLRTQPPARADGAPLIPERLRGLTLSEVAALRPALRWRDGGRRRPVRGVPARAPSRSELVLAGDLRSVDRGSGARMSGGQIEVRGDVGAWAGAEMAGGVLRILGDSGARLGAAYPGARVGMTGGEIVVTGDAGEEAGAGMRRGLVAVGGRTESGAGLRMLAGTVIALGGIGAEAGLGNKRGSLVSGRAVEPLPAYAFATRFQPPALRLQLRRVRELGLTVDDALLRGTWARWSGDRTELTRGEILIFDDDEEEEGR